MKNLLVRGDMKACMKEYMATYVSKTYRNVFLKVLRTSRMILVTYRNVSYSSTIRIARLW